MVVVVSVVAGAVVVVVGAVSAVVVVDSCGAQAIRPKLRNSKVSRFM